MNIIFDLGGVVLNWEPEKLIKDAFPDMTFREKISTELHEHPDWTELDRGNLSFEEAALRAESRTGIPASDILNMLNQVGKVLIPKNDTLKLIEELHKKGHKLYVLSNMSLEVADYLEEEHSFWDMFNGIVYSARINLIKPESEIFYYILDKYNLKPEETVFFDDMKVNVDSALRLGIHGIQFFNAKQAKEELENL